MQKFLGKLYPDTALSNVSHLFEAMGLFPFLTEIPWFGIDAARLVSFGLSVFWDLGVSPAHKTITSGSPRAAWGYDSQQFANYDAAGIAFGYDWLQWSKDGACNR